MRDERTLVAKSSEELREARAGRDRGAALFVALVTMLALLGVAAITLLSVQSELGLSAQSRFDQAALYAAESGQAASVDYLRSNCNTSTLFGALVEPSNSSPQSPTGIYGNSKAPGQAGNPFPAARELWYEISVLNNMSDTGYSAGDDADGIVTLRAVGHGPDESQAVSEMTVKNNTCGSTFTILEWRQDF